MTDLENMTGGNEDPGELKRQLEGLKEHYRRLVASISEGVAVVTVDGIITSLSPAFEELTGWPPSQLVGSDVQSFVHPADLPLVIERIQRLNNGEQLPPTRLRLLQSSGMYRPVEITAQPEVVDGKVSGRWILVRDLSKDEQLAQQQEQIKQEKQRIQSLVDLIRAATTQARSPLTAVNLNVYRLSRKIGEQPPLTSLENIELHVQRLTRLLERVLTMAELDADRVHFTFTPVHLKRILDYIQSSMYPLIAAKNIVFTVTLTDDFPLVRADELQLYRAIKEVIENALENTPENGTVTVRVFRNEPDGVVEVQDTGIGITPDLMPHLFERFYRFSLPVSAPGKLGLGLPIAKKIIEKHSGSINVASEPGNGSTFTIAIPLYR